MFEGPISYVSNCDEGALPMRAPESVVGMQTFRRREIHDGTRCAKRSCFTHRETLTRELAVAPAPGKHLRSAEPRQSRIYRLQLTLSAATDTQSEPAVLALCGPARASLSRRRRTFDESPGEHSWNSDFPADVTLMEPRGALDGAVSLIASRLRARYRLPLHPGRTCGALSRGPEGFID